MRHARMLAPLALAVVLAASLVPAAQAASKRSTKSASVDTPASPRKAAAYHQFTGTVVSLDESSMAAMNYQVDGDKMEPRDVARDFLKAKGIVK